MKFLFLAGFRIFDLVRFNRGAQRSTENQKKNRLVELLRFELQLKSTTMAEEEEKANYGASRACACAPSAAPLLPLLARSLLVFERFFFFFLLCACALVAARGSAHQSVFGDIHFVKNWLYVARSRRRSRRRCRLIRRLLARGVEARQCRLDAGGAQRAPRRGQHRLSGSLACLQHSFYISLGAFKSAGSLTHQQ